MMITYKMILVIIPVCMTITTTCVYFKAEVFFPEEGSEFRRHIGNNFIPLKGGNTERKTQAAFWYLQY